MTTTTTAPCPCQHPPTEHHPWTMLGTPVVWCDPCRVDGRVCIATTSALTDVDARRLSDAAALAVLHHTGEPGAEPPC